ncbi:hypothetical protein [Massilia endophytica]|uniref:hypothetical protein n=1 Tax=Massilia endophytica TaxID=2899220 RepID=UPI001E5DFD91|nr:hypothetical protein [Massilia endophytica]UGQ47360.1 hypothetical protein LSQ66_02445 [Massilia endophytica]
MKKALLVLSFGLGLGVSLTGYTAPTRATCEAIWQKCIAGDQDACDNLVAIHCDTLYGYNP